MTDNNVFRMFVPSNPKNEERMAQKQKANQEEILADLLLGRFEEEIERQANFYRMNPDTVKKAVERRGFSTKSGSDKVKKSTASQGTSASSMPSGSKAGRKRKYSEEDNRKIAGVVRDILERERCFCSVSYILRCLEERRYDDVNRSRLQYQILDRWKGRKNGFKVVKNRTRSRTVGRDVQYLWGLPGWRYNKKDQVNL